MAESQWQADYDHALRCLANNEGTVRKHEPIIRGFEELRPREDIATSYATACVMGHVVRAGFWTWAQDAKMVRMRGQQDA
jgi:hypothetical protein